MAIRTSAGGGCSTGGRTLPTHGATRGAGWASATRRARATPRHRARPPRAPRTVARPAARAGRCHTLAPPRGLRGRVAAPRRRPLTPATTSPTVATAPICPKASGVSPRSMTFSHVTDLPSIPLLTKPLVIPTLALTPAGHPAASVPVPMAVRAAVPADAPVRVAAVVAARVAAPLAAFHAGVRGRPAAGVTFAAGAGPVAAPVVGPPRKAALPAGGAGAAVPAGGLLAAVAGAPPGDGGARAGVGPREGPVRALAVVAGAVAGLDAAVPEGAAVGTRPVKAAQVGGGLPGQAGPALLGLRPLLHVGGPVAAPPLAGHEGEDAAGGRGVPVAPARP